MRQLTFVTDRRTDGLASWHKREMYIITSRANKRICYVMVIVSHKILPGHCPLLQFASTRRGGSKSRVEVDVNNHTVDRQRPSWDTGTLTGSWLAGWLGRFELPIHRDNDSRRFAYSAEVRASAVR